MMCDTIDDEDEFAKKEVQPHGKGKRKLGAKIKKGVTQVVLVEPKCNPTTPIRSHFLQNGSMSSFISHTLCFQQLP
jgi:hypothetical protein